MPMNKILNSLVFLLINEGNFFLMVITADLALTGL